MPSTATRRLASSSSSVALRRFVYVSEFVARCASRDASSDMVSDPPSVEAALWLPSDALTNTITVHNVAIASIYRQEERCRIRWIQVKRYQLIS